MVFAVIEGRTRHVTDSAKGCVKLVTPSDGPIEFLTHLGNLFRNFVIHLLGQTGMDSTLVDAQACLKGVTRFLKRCVSGCTIADWFRKNHKWTRGHSSQQDHVILRAYVKKHYSSSKSIRIYESRCYKRDQAT